VAREVERGALVRPGEVEVAARERQLVAQRRAGATISPDGATMIELPIWSTPSSHPAFAAPTTQVPFW